MAGQKGNRLQQEQWGCLCPILPELRALWALDPLACQNRGMWVERPVYQGAGVAEWWELEEGLALWARLFGKGIVLLLLTKPQPTCRAWLGTCNCPG